MKVFRFKFTKITLGAIYLGLAVAAIAFAVNTYFVITTGISSAMNVIYPIIQYSVTYFVAVLLFVILVSILIDSNYKIDGKILITSFGIIKSKYKIDEIETVSLDRNTNKLSVYFTNRSFIVIVVKQDWYDEFIDGLLEANRNIEFSIQSKENENKDDDKKN